MDGGTDGSSEGNIEGSGDVVGERDGESEGTVEGWTLGVLLGATDGPDEGLSVNRKGSCSNRYITTSESNGLSAWTVSILVHTLCPRHT